MEEKKKKKNKRWKRERRRKGKRVGAPRDKVVLITTEGYHCQGQAHRLHSPATVNIV